MAERIIGFIGLAGAGKDTAAAAMQDEFRGHGQEARIDSFADPIRRISQIVRLDPYDRRRKEVQCTFTLDGFCDAFQHGIDQVLGNRLFEHERAELYAFTMEALARFTFEGFGGTDICLSPREFMQVLGTEGGQRVHRNLWVELAVARWRAAPGIVLVPDCRFEQELAVLDTPVIVTRPGVLPVNNHASERLAAQLTLAADAGVPFLRLRNDGDKEALRASAQALAWRIKAGGYTGD